MPTVRRRLDEFPEAREAIMQHLRTKPSTASELQAALIRHRSKVRSCLDYLARHGRIVLGEARRWRVVEGGTPCAQ